MELPQEGDVWIETVTPKIGNDRTPWQRLHFVTGTKGYWLTRDHPKTAVYSISKDQSDRHQTDLEDFLKFEFSGFSVGMVPCIEQRSLEELQAISDGRYPQPDGADALQLAEQTLKLLDKHGD